MHLDVEVVDGRPILEVAIEPIRLLDENDPDLRTPTQIAQHVTEGGSTSLSGRLYVDVA